MIKNSHDSTHELAKLSSLFSAFRKCLKIQNWYHNVLCCLCYRTLLVMFCVLKFYFVDFWNWMHVLCKVGKNIIFQNKTLGLLVMFYRIIKHFGTNFVILNIFWKQKIVKTVWPVRVYCVESSSIAYWSVTNVTQYKTGLLNWNYIVCNIAVILEDLVFCLDTTSLQLNTPCEACQCLWSVWSSLTERDWFPSPRQYEVLY